MPCFMGAGDQIQASYWLCKPTSSALNTKKNIITANICKCGTPCNSQCLLTLDRPLRNSPITGTFVLTGQGMP